jgi:hypothetical protein
LYHTYTGTVSDSFILQPQTGSLLLPKILHGRVYYSWNCASTRTAHELWHCTATVLLHTMRTSPCPPIGFQAPNYVRPNLPLAPANAALLVTVKHYCITDNGFYDAYLPNSFQGQCRAGRCAVKWTADVAPGYSDSWEYCLCWPGCEAYPVRRRQIANLVSSLF